jgi:hypothetical protein
MDILPRAAVRTREYLCPQRMLGRVPRASVAGLVVAHRPHFRVRSGVRGLGAVAGLPARQREAHTSTSTCCHYSRFSACSAFHAWPHLPCSAEHVDANLQDAPCERIEYGDGETRRYLAADLALSCDTDEYKTTYNTAIAMLLVWPVGMPLLYAMLLWASRHTFHTGIPTPLSAATAFLSVTMQPSGGSRSRCARDVPQADNRGMGLADQRGLRAGSRDHRDLCQHHVLRAQLALPAAAAVSSGGHKNREAQFLNFFSLTHMRVISSLAGSITVR